MPRRAAFARLALGILCLAIATPLSLNAQISDSDDDGVPDTFDNCAAEPNGPLNGGCVDGPFKGQACISIADCDGSLCDTSQLDTDADEVGDVCDNCPETSNSDQTDTDGNGIGDACETQEDVPALSGRHLLLLALAMAGVALAISQDRQFTPRRSP